MKHYLLFYSCADGYLERRPAFREAHLRHAWEAQKRGALVLAGAVGDPLDAGLFLFEAQSPAPVESFARADPYVVNGLVTDWRVREWLTVVGAAAASSVRPAGARRNIMPISYALEPDLAAEEFRALLIASTLGERRPVDDLPRLERMLRQADVIATARDGARLVGISRAITDFSYCCYLSDLAVDADYQRQGIGKRLIAETHKAAGALTTLILLAAPAARSYYPRIGMQQHLSCWTVSRTR